ALFSMMTCWPRLSLIRCATIRAIVSGNPPGEYGTIILIGLLGYGCAQAAGAIDIRITHSAPRDEESIRFIGQSSVGVANRAFISHCRAPFSILRRPLRAHRLRQ